ncbi:MAG TPA: methyltransferase domain-containing protein [Phycisphaerales bacterium]|nr:methyltransferase domain-containing protein [Phycisphaerales bacterium]
MLALPRRLQPELMDNPALDAGEHRRALTGLARINMVSRAGAGLWGAVRELLPHGRPVTLLDVAVGSGDVAVDVARRARGAGVSLGLEVCDISGEALSATQERSVAAGVAVGAHRRDVVKDGLPQGDRTVDVVMCSLFLHHLREPDVVRLLAEMARVSRRGVVVSDLRRCRAGVAAAVVAGRVLTRSRIVRVDAVRSVEGAFTIGELRAMAAEAGMVDADVRASWPLRMMLTWRRP